MQFLPLELSNPQMLNLGFLRISLIIRCFSRVQLPPLGIKVSRRVVDELSHDRLRVAGRPEHRQASPGTAARTFYFRSNPNALSRLVAFSLSRHNLHIHSRAAVTRDACQPQVSLGKMAT